MGAAFEIRTDATNHVNQKFDTLGQPVSYKSHAEIIYFLFFFFLSLSSSSRGRIFFMKVTEQHRIGGSRGDAGFTCLILKNYVSAPGFVCGIIFRINGRFPLNGGTVEKLMTDYFIRYESEWWVGTCCLCCFFVFIFSRLNLDLSDGNNNGILRDG